MKKFLLLISCVVFFGCNKDDSSYNCNFLLNVGVNLIVDLNLPQFNQILYTGGAIRVEGHGNEGIILVRSSSNTILAWDGADPSHAPSACSAMTIVGLNAVCGCADSNEYSLITGTPLNDNSQPCTLKPYRVEAIGNNSFRISN